MEKLKIAVVIGSTRESRFGEKPAKWIFEEAKKLPDVEVELLDLRDYEMPFYEQATTPSMITNGDYGHEIVNKWAQKIAWADAFIMVTPEYNHSTSAVLKNAIDHVYAEWNNKVVGFVAYGSVAGARAVEHLRNIAAELQMASVRNAVHIPGNIVFPINMGKAEWNAEVEAHYKDNADGMLKQLVVWGRAFKAIRG